MADIFNDNLARLEEAKKSANFSDAEIALLSKHKRVKKAMLEVDGEKFEAWRIVHNDALGPGKGGIRYHPGVSEDEVKSLSFWMSLKNSLAGLPYGGAKGGVKFDPKVTSPEKMEKISRAFIDSFYEVLGQDIDVPAPDVYTNGQIMAWMLDEFEKKVGHHEPGMITGKPLELGGCPLRDDATAKGGFIVISEFLKTLSVNKAGLKVAIQGFGNAGAHLARMLFEDGFEIVATSDSQGAIFSDVGIDITKLAKIKAENGSVTAYPDGQKMTNEAMLESNVDLLILAALENQVREDNVNRIQAKYIIEIANGPITYGADKILKQKKVLVVPDILANSGGVIVSYFEWCQNRTGQILDVDYLEAKLPKILAQSWQNVWRLYQEKNGEIDLRIAAYIIAIKRILAAEKLRGNIKI